MPQTANGNRDAVSSTSSRIGRTQRGSPSSRPTTPRRRPPSTARAPTSSGTSMPSSRRCCSDASGAAARDHFYPLTLQQFGRRPNGPGEPGSAPARRVAIAAHSRPRDDRRENFSVRLRPKDPLPSPPSHPPPSHSWWTDKRRPVNPSPGSIELNVNSKSDVSGRTQEVSCLRATGSVSTAPFPTLKS